MRIMRIILVATILLVLINGVIGQEKMNWNEFDHCTSVIVSKDASVDGSVMTTHSCDGNWEFRIHLVPGKNHKARTMRPVYKGGGRGRERAQAKIVGEIPEVEQTFARFDAAYPFMNEKQVAIGETTIDDVKKELYNDEGLFDIMALERIVLERASTAREAIKVMGDLASKYGYCDFGECLTVIDPKEAWMFEIFGAGPIEKGAVWAARRIPDGHIGVSANRSRITTLDLKDKDHYMASENVFSVAEEMGWWDSKSGEEFVFNEAYGDTPSVFICTMREWRVFNLLAPSVKLDPFSTDIPFSVKPDNKVSPQDLMRVHRDYYQGTEFDMTKGLAAGPFGSPNRWATRPRPPIHIMGWQRPVSIFRCAYCVVMQSRDWLPDPIGGLVWYAVDDPKTSCFVPLYCSITDLPECYQVGGRDKFERESAFWAFNFVANWADLKFSYMIEDIKEKYQNFEDRFFAQQDSIEAAALKLYQKKPALAQQYLTEYSVTNAQNTVDAWWELGEFLITKYNDGYINLPHTGKPVGYPIEWREKVGYGKIRLKK